MDVLVQKLGVSFFDTEGNARDLNSVLMEAREAWKNLTDEEAANYAKKIAGQEAISGWLAIMDASDEDVQKLTVSLRDATGAAEEMAKIRLDNLAGDITYLQSAFGTLQIVINDALKGGLRKFVQFGTSAVKALTEGFKGNGITGFMSALSSIVTDGVTMLAGKASEFFNIGKSLIFHVLEGLLNAKDAIFDAANKIMMDFTSSFLSIPMHYGEQLREVGTGIIELIATGFSRADSFISEYLGDFVPVIAQGFLAYHETLFSIGADILGSIGQGIVDSKDKIRSMTSGTISNMVTALRDNAPSIIEGGLALLEALVGAIEENLPLIVATGAEIIGRLVAGIATASPAVQAIIGTAVLPHILKIVETVGSIGTAVGSVVKLVGSGINSVISIGTKLMGGIQALWALMAANPITLVIAAIAALAAGFVALWNTSEGFRNFWIGLWDGIVNVAKSAASMFADIGKNIVDGIKNGISNAWKSLTNFVGGLFDGLVGGVKKLLGIASPSKVFAGIGGNMALGLERGWEDEYADIRREIENGLSFSTGNIGVTATSAYNAAGTAQSAPQAGFGGWGNTTINIYNPEKRDAVTEAREWKKTTQRMAMSYA